MILPIYLYGHPVLRKVAQPLPSHYPNLSELVDNMFETLAVSEGCGLAAPQIGLSFQLFVVDGTVLFKEQPEKFPECENFRQVFINPTIEPMGNDTVSYNEGCLSLPGISESVKRPKTIKVTFSDTDMQQHTEIYTAFSARIILHEYDHLQGHVFTDLLSPIRKQFVKKQLNRIEKGKEIPPYKYAR